jgi:hypothetical protein
MQVTKLIRFVFLIMFVAFGTSAYAQDECIYGIDPNCEEADAPIDSGVGLLMGAIALYSVKRLRQKKEE